MKRPLQLPLAIALALGGVNAFALGLGSIQVRSGLNQPLNAEIPIIQSSPGEAEGLIVQLASAEDFERVGLTRSGVAVPLEFSLGKNARGEPVVKITTQEAVREPYIGFLVEANWPKGRLLREYTLLLDPPTMAPAIKGTTAVAIAAREPERAIAQPLPATRPAAPATRPAPAAVAAEPAPAPRTPSTPRTASDSEYGPVAAGETLTEIARATRHDESVNINQMMVALLRHNPNAFYKDNINALKRGAVLRVPSVEEIAATGSAREAAVNVRAQIDEWRGVASAAPARVVNTGSAAVETPATSSSSVVVDERLALVPPRAGNGGQGAGDRRGGSGTGNAASQAELTRVQEALTSREQEASELKSRLKDMEELKAKNDRLIALQNSDLADLRRKLQELQAQPAAATPATASEPTLIVATPEAAPATEVAAEPVTEAPAASGEQAAEDIWGSAAISSESAITTPETAVTDAEQGASTEVDGSEAASTEALSSDAEIDAAAASLNADAEPATVTADAPPVVAEAQPEATARNSAPAAVTPATPWYMQPWVLGLAGLLGLLLVFLGIKSSRGSKPEKKATRDSIAGAFGASPLGADVDGAQHDFDQRAEEEALIAKVHAAPHDAEAHLELLSLYYVQRDVANFEAAAEEMYTTIADPNQFEWREARTMGEDLCPHNPLFGGEADLTALAAHDAAMDSADPFAFDDSADVGGLDADDYRLDVPAAKASDSHGFSHSADFNAAPPAPFGLNLDDLGESRPAPSSADDSFSFDDLPPLASASDVSESRDSDSGIDLDMGIDMPEFSTTPIASAPSAGTELDHDEFSVTEFDSSPAALDLDDGFAGVGDAVDTKLDLARAYLDLGDADAARAMLDEVISEGSTMQQDEARKLIGDIG